MKVGLGVVTEVHPEDHSVDVVMVEDQARLSGVIVLGEMLTSRSGHNDLHETGTSKDGQKWSSSASRSDQDQVAVVIYGDQLPPLVFGFLPQQVSQLLFKRANFRVDRHPSDVYSTIDAAGNIELSHPSGTYFRIAENPDHEDLTGQDYDGKWKVDRNTSRAPWAALDVLNAGSRVARFRIDPSGNILLDHIGNLTTHTGGNATVTVDGNAALHVTGNFSATVGGTTTWASSGNLTFTAPKIFWNQTG